MSASNVNVAWAHPTWERMTMHAARICY
jgi:hypothetical protein